MIRKKGTLALVINGDWNNLFTQPSWMAHYVFEQDTIEVGLGGIGNTFGIVCKYNNITVSPTPNKMVFSVLNSENENIELFCKYVNNFLEKSYTPVIESYGLNADFTDDSAIYAELVDSMGDVKGLNECGCEILSTDISRSVKFDDKVYYLEFTMQGKEFLLHVNEHHKGGFEQKEAKPVSVADIETFLENCWKIAQSLGYKKED